MILEPQDKQAMFETFKKLPKESQFLFLRELAEQAIQLFKEQGFRLDTKAMQIFQRACAWVKKGKVQTQDFSLLCDNVANLIDAKFQEHTDEFLRVAETEENKPTYRDVNFVSILGWTSALSGLWEKQQEFFLWKSDVKERQGKHFLAWECFDKAIENYIELWLQGSGYKKAKKLPEKLEKRLKELYADSRLSATTQEAA